MPVVLRPLAKLIIGIFGIIGISGIFGIIWYNYCVMVWLKNTAINRHKGYYATSYGYCGNYSNVLNKC